MKSGPACPQKKLVPAKIKILFICSSLDPGKDGVGDYARKLASALINLGHSAAMIAINERCPDETIWEEKQYDNDTAVNVLRLSSSVSWESRIKKAEQFVDAFDPDWMSLQYVPFGF